MARSKPKYLQHPEPKLDMSPMIDLVFVLLMFFMIASKMITFKKDQRVTIPIASSTIVAKMVNTRVVINVYADGTIGDENSNIISVDDVERIMMQTKAKDPDTRLHVRADKGVSHKSVKEVIAASARGGVNEVIFSTYNN